MMLCPSLLIEGTRMMAICFSFSVMYLAFVFSGVSGKKRKPKIAIGRVMIPSVTMRCQCSVDPKSEAIKSTLPIKNTHCQPTRPPLPAMPLLIAVIITPANIVPTCPEAVKRAVRLAISLGLYQAPIM
jgi:hypothetical protein